MLTWNNLDEVAQNVKVEKIETPEPKTVDSNKASSKFDSKEDVRMAPEEQADFELVESSLRKRSKKHSSIGSSSLMRGGIPAPEEEPASGNHLVLKGLILGGESELSSPYLYQGP